MVICWLTFAIATWKLKEWDHPKEDNRLASALAAAGAPQNCQPCTAIGTAHPTSSNKKRKS